MDSFWLLVGLLNGLWMGMVIGAVRMSHYYLYEKDQPREPEVHDDH